MLSQKSNGLKFHNLKSKRKSSAREKKFEPDGCKYQAKTEIGNVQILKILRDYS